MNLGIGVVGLLVGVYIYFVIIPTTTIIPPGVKAPQYISIDFMPKLWTLICIISSLGLIIQSLLAIRKVNFQYVIQVIKDNALHLKSSTFSFIASMVVLIVYVVTLPYLGFIINSTLFLMVAMYWFGYRGFLKISFLSIAITLLCYAFYVYVLNANLSV
jgi:divalent metal cation (Fe/Co/Zn/Cd) transporter